MSRDFGESASPARLGKKLSKIMIVAGVGLTFLSLMAAGTLAIHLHAGAGDDQASAPPLSVNTDTIKIVASYTITQSFAGRLEASRETRMAFERGGLVLKVFVNEGDFVEEGAIVAALDTAQLENRKQQLVAQRNELRAQLSLAEATFKRISSLKKKGWTPTQSFDEARYNVQQLKASLERISASIGSVSIDIGKSQLKAPFAGTIAVRNIDEGSVVGAGTPILTVMENSRKQIRVGVSVEAAEALKVRRSYQFRIHGKKYTGFLVSKRPDLQTGTRTVTALFEFRNSNHIPLGEIAELILEREVARAGAWIPLTALHEGQKGLWTVYKVVSKDGVHTVKREAVEILHSSDGRVFVRGTFSDGDRVIINGASRIIPGQAIALAGGR